MPLLVPTRAMWNNTCEQCWCASWSSTVFSSFRASWQILFSNSFIKWPYVPGWEKHEDLIKASNTLAFAVMISLPLSAYEGQIGMNHEMGVRSQDHAIFMSRCALGRSFQSSDPVLSICFPELQIVPLPSCCFMSCKCKFALWQNESYAWWRFRHSVLWVCRSYVSLRQTFWCVLLIVYICYQRRKKNRKGKLAAYTAKRPGSGYNHI